MTLKKLIFGMAAVLSFGAASSASASVSFTEYAADQCEVVSGGDEASFLVGMVTNQSTTATLTVSCPVLKTSNDLSALIVRAVDNNTSDDVSCIVAGIDSNSGGAAFMSYGQTSGASSNTSTIILQPNAGLSSGHYFLRCDLAPGTTMRSYVAVEL